MRVTLFIKSAKIIIALAGFQIGMLNPCQAQLNEGMLIFQVDGNRYTRKNFDEYGVLKNFQTIEIGKISVFEKKTETKMTVLTYETDGTLKEASQTTLICTPESRQVLMGIFPFAGGKSKRSLLVKMNDSVIMYPPAWTTLTELNDFHFSLNFKGGAVGFFGTKSKVSIINRKVTPLDGTFEVTGKLIMKIYILGIKVSKINYEFNEEIDERKGIIRQKFKNENGEYFTIELKN